MKINAFIMTWTNVTWLNATKCMILLVWGGSLTQCKYPEVVCDMTGLALTCLEIEVEQKQMWMDDGFKSGFVTTYLNYLIQKCCCVCFPSEKEEKDQLEFKIKGKIKFTKSEWFLLSLLKNPLLQKHLTLPVSDVYRELTAFIACGGRSFKWRCTPLRSNARTNKYDKKLLSCSNRTTQSLYSHSISPQK